MVGSILSASGETFDVDAFLKASPWLLTARIYRKGEKSPLKGRPARSSSGLQIDIAEAGGYDLKTQIQKTVAFFDQYDSELERLRSFAGVEDIELTIGSWWYSDTAAKIVTLPPKLVSRAGKHGIEINVGVYATSKVEQVPV